MIFSKQDTLIFFPIAQIKRETPWLYLKCNHDPASTKADKRVILVWWVFFFFFFFSARVHFFQMLFKIHVIPLLELLLLFLLATENNLHLYTALINRSLMFVSQSEWPEGAAVLVDGLLSSSQ